MCEFYQRNTKTDTFDGLVTAAVTQRFHCNVSFAIIDDFFQSSKNRITFAYNEIYIVMFER